MSSQIQDDIERWSDKKLQQWFLDSVERYKMIDLPGTAAMSATGATMMIALAQVLAASNAPPDEAADTLADLIVRYRIIQARVKAARVKAARVKASKEKAAAFGGDLAARSSDEIISTILERWKDESK
jgi:hypothetical protein